MQYMLYKVIGPAIQGVFIYLFFHRILDMTFRLKKDSIPLLVVTVIYTAYMFYSKALIIEPFRSISSMLFLSIYFKLRTKIRIGYAFFIVFISRLTTIGTMYMALFLSAKIVYFILRISDHNFFIAYYISLLIKVVLNITAYRTIFKTKFSFIFYKDMDLGSPFISALVMMLFAYSSFHLLYDNNLLLLNVFLGVMFFTGSLFFVLYIRVSIKKQNEKLVLIKKNDSLREDNHKLADWLPGLDKWVKEIMCFIDDPEIRDALVKGLSLDQIEVLMQNRQSQLYRQIKIPATGLLSLDGYFAEQKEESERKKIAFKVMVEIKLDYLFEKGIEHLCINRLVVNSVSNAFKELEKTAVAHKEIQVWFQMNENNNYQISILDNAHPFDLDILAKLGTRGNSTNETGYGWADNIELLYQCRASIEIFEYEPDNDEFTKKITIIFDDKNELNIHSYRQEEISLYVNRCAE